MEMPVEKIIPLWQDYLNGVAAQRMKILRLPPSAVFNDETIFTSFVKTNDISLAQPTATR